MNTAIHQAISQSISISPSVFYFGTPVVLLSTLNPDGSTNLTPISSAWALGDHYVLGLGTDSKASANLASTGEVVLNLMGATQVEAVERLAPTTGMDPVPPAKQDRYRYEIDKWTLAGLTRVASERVAPSRVAQCPVQLEAQVVEQRPLIDGAQTVVCQVVCTHAHCDIVLPGTDHIDLDRWQPLYYTFRHYFGQGTHLGQNFKAEY